MSREPSPDAPTGWLRVRGTARDWLHSSGPRVWAEPLVNFVLPFLVFILTRQAWGDVHALMAACAPPIAWSIFEFVERRRIDALSLVVLAGIAFSLLAFLGGGGARFLQLRERLATAAIGLVFLGSAAIGKPIVYRLACARIRRKSAAEAQSFEALRDNPLFRHAMMVMTLAWGAGLVLESAVACALVFVLTIPQYLVVSPIVGYCSLGALTAWTFWYATRRVRAARRLAEGESGRTPPLAQSPSHDRGTRATLQR